MYDALDNERHWITKGVKNSHFFSVIFSEIGIVFLEYGDEQSV